MENKEPQIEIPHIGYVFRIDMIAGGYVYFTTFTECVSVLAKRRESRKPSSVKTTTMVKALSDLGHSFYIVEDNLQFRYWLEKQGWAIVGKDFCTKNMKQWLSSCLCLKKPSDAYSAVNVCSKASQRRPEKALKDVVYGKYGKTCLCCNRSEDIKITLHHIRPFSKGGESAINNLIPLCEQCNQGIADNFLPELYDKIGVIYGYDLSVLKGKLDIKTWQWLMRLSSNLMHTRCDLT